MAASFWISAERQSVVVEPALRRTGMTGEAIRLRHHLGVLPGPRAEIMLTQEGRILGDTALRAGGCHPAHVIAQAAATRRSEEHTSELQSLMRKPYAVFCWNKHKS